jgi:hypothetical protein
MMDSFLKGRSGLHGAAQLGDLSRAQGPGWEFFYGAEGDAVGLAQGAVDGAGFGHAHLGVVEDEGGDVAGVGVPVPDEAPALGRLIDRGLEHPEALPGLAKGEHRLSLDAVAMASLGESQQISVGHEAVSATGKVGALTGWLVTGFLCVDSYSFHR